MMPFPPDAYRAGNDPLVGAGLPGEATTDNPNFIMQGVMDCLPLGTLLEMAAMAGMPGEGRPGAADVTLLPTASVTYPDGTRAQPVSLLLSTTGVLGIWQGRAAAPDALVAADWMLPYCMSDPDRKTNRRTFFKVFAGTPGGAVLRPAWGLLPSLFDWTKIADEVDADAREGQPRHPLYGMLRTPPIVTYRPRTDAADVAAEDDPALEPPDVQESIFAERLASLLAAGQPFYGHQAATAAGVSNSLARFYLRRMAARGQLATVEVADNSRRKGS